MSQLVVSPYLTILDSNGNPISGAVIKFSLTGTTTPASVYADPGRSTPLGATVTCNAAGRAADGSGNVTPIYLALNTTYRMRVFETAMATDPIIDNDPVDNLGGDLTQAGGAGLVGFNHNQTYPAATIGAALDQYKSVMDAPFNAAADGTTDDTAAVAAAIAYGGRILFPAGHVFKCNIDVNGLEGVHLVGESQGQGGSTGVRLIPADATKPVMTIRDNCIDCGAENFLIDSKLDGTYSHTGKGIVFSALSPNFVWRCFLRHIFIRGFNTGFEIDCDVNAGEVFGNDFEDIECIGCSDYSFKTLGVYNYYRKLFATQCGISGSTSGAGYVILNQGSNSVFDSVVGDGRMYFSGAGQHVKNAVIEDIYSDGQGTGFDAFEVNGNTSTFDGIRLTNVPNAKFGIGVSIFGTGQKLSNIVVEGADFPTEAVLINGSSSGDMTNASAPGGVTPITGTASSATLGAWTFNGDVSAIYGGYCVWTPVLTPAGGTITATVNKEVIRKQSNVVTGICEFTVTGVSTPTGALTIAGLPYTPTQDAAVDIYADGLDGTTVGVLQGKITTGSTSISIKTFASGVAADVAAKIINGTTLTVSFSYLA